MIVYVLQSCYGSSIIGTFVTLEEAIRAGEKSIYKNNFLVYEKSKIRNTKRLVFESMN